MSSKRRLTVTVDEDVLGEGRVAVARGSAESLSAWVNAALRDRADKERRLHALAEFVSSYEGDFGHITAEEIASQQRADRVAARIVRPAPRTARTARTA